MNFKQFIEGRRGIDHIMGIIVNGQIEVLKREVKKYNQRMSPQSVMSVSRVNDSDDFTLYIDGELITSGEVADIAQRVININKEMRT